LSTERNGHLAPAAVAALYLQHAEELRAFLLGVVRDPELAGEVLQATFAKAVELGHTARAESVKGWLFQVAFHEALALRRKRATADKASRKLAEIRPTTADPPEENLCRWETVEKVREALQELTPDQRRVVQMRIYEGLTFAAIAETLQIPLGTALTRMRAALQQLKKVLESRT